MRSRYDQRGRRPDGRLQLGDLRAQRVVGRAGRRSNLSRGSRLRGPNGPALPPNGRDIQVSHTPGAAIDENEPICPLSFAHLRDSTLPSLVGAFCPRGRSTLEATCLQ